MICCVRRFWEEWDDVMKKKERKLCRALDRRMGLVKGANEVLARSSKESKCAIIRTARKEKLRCSK